MLFFPIIVWTAVDAGLLQTVSQGTADFMSNLTLNYVLKLRILTVIDRTVMIMPITEVVITSHTFQMSS